jgi:dUTP pyrophosphatase
MKILPIPIHKSMKENPMRIALKKVHALAKTPAQAHDTDAGYDLFSVEEVWIKPGQRAMIDTGIQIAVPPGFYARIAPRSGLALKAGIDVLAGVIDAGFRNNVKVILINLSDGGEEQSFKVNPHDKIAQMIIEKCHSVNFDEVENLDDTPRGFGGFGSSGS